MIYRRLFGVTIALISVIAAGALGYRVIEGWSFFDALYMTIITIASVGFMEVHELSAQGRIFTIILILCGSATLIYGLSTLTAFIVEGELTDVLRRRKMLGRISRLENHYIVCGLSATGRYIVEELLKTGRSFVAIDRDPVKLRELHDADILTIEGDATQDAVLDAANIRKAEGLLSALHADADNLFVVVTAKGLNPRLKIVAKAVNEESESKLRKVGADRVVMPDFIGGLRMASEMIRPSVVSFLDSMLRTSEATVRVEEILIPDRSPMAGKSLADSGLLEVEGVTVVALADDRAAYCFNPPRDRILRGGEVVIVMGVVSNILSMKSKVSAS